MIYDTYIVIIIIYHYYYYHINRHAVLSLPADTQAKVLNK